jgi:23S rRNA (cytosine1962-C5)-methyltransferase
MSVARAIVTKKGAARLKVGHPWVFASDIVAVQGNYEPGDVVEIADERGRFLGQGYFNPRSQIALRFLTPGREEIGPAFWQRRLEAAWEYRRRFVDTSSCRVVFAEADFIPALIVDKFGDYLVMQSLALGIARWENTLVELLVELLAPRGIYARNDVKVREIEGLPLEKGYLYGKFDPLIQIEEHGLRFWVDVENGQKTGYFLDQRENRAALAPFVPGARVLDCFCHTGAFALHAAFYGAREVVGIDISPEAVAMAKKNAQLNGLDPVCRFKVGNVFDELRALAERRERYDVVILDPPAFTKSRQALEGAARGYKEINLRALKLIPPGGFLVTASCSQHMSSELFRAIVAEAASDTNRRLRLVEYRRQAKDHPVLVAAPETEYLKFFIFQVF